METVNVYETGDAASRAAAAAFALAVADAAASRGVAHVALSGSRTPVAMFELLVDPAQPFREFVPWDALHVWWADERHVPPDHPDSNYRLAREAMLSQVPLRAAQVHRIAGELDAEQAASRYDEEMGRAFRIAPEEVPAFDLIHLGIGEDAHTASLFPHSPALEEHHRRAVVNRVAATPPVRITVTFPVLLNARNLLVLVTGPSKVGALAAVFRPDADPQTYPAVMLRHSPHRVRWIVDRDAAARLDAIAAPV